MFRLNAGGTSKVKPPPDPELESHYSAFAELNTLIHDEWQIGCHDDLGAHQPAHRPKPYSAGHDVIRRRGYRWMSENGVTERSKSAGYIDDCLNCEYLAELLA